MIITLTPNPSLDLLFQADRLVWDDANRLPTPRRRAGGQGVNVVRAARSLEPDVEAVAVAPLGGRVGAELETALRNEGTPVVALPIRGETRLFVGVREREGRSLLLNPRGPALDATDAERLLLAVSGLLDDAEAAGHRAWLACCGSLPPGLPADLYARAGQLARRRGHRFVPDCDGDALRAAATAGCDLLVPNAHEAARLLGTPVEPGRTAEDAARALLGLGPAAAAITLGAEGAVAANAHGVWRATVALTPELREETEAGSAVGAGDAFLAALLLGLRRDDPLPECLAAAVAAGSAALLSRGTDLLSARDVARVRPLVRVSRLGP